MSSPRKQNNSRAKRPPATTPEGREKQLISLAVDLAERQLSDGTASATVITHYLKLATNREQLERQKLAYETELLKAKKESIDSQQRIEELYSNALNAMRSYSPNPRQHQPEEEDEDFY